MENFKMKIKTQLLLTALKELKPIVPMSSQIPIAACAKITTGDKLTITVTDFDQSSVRTLDFNGEIETCCVNFNMLLYSIGEADETMLMREDNYLLVKCGHKTSRVPLVDAKDFPEEPDAKGFKLIGTNPADIAIGMRAVHGFEHKDRDNIMNTSILGCSKFIECKATDGATIAIWNCPLISADFEAAIPSKFCDALADALAIEGAELRLSKNMALVNWPNGSYFCKLSENLFPSTKSITDTEVKLIGKLDIKPIMRELEACCALTPQSQAPAMSLRFLGGKLKTLFLGSNENIFEGEYPVSYQCRINAKSMHRCLSAFGESCEIYGDERLLKMTSHDLTIYSTLMRS